MSPRRLPVRRSSTSPRRLSAGLSLAGGVALVLALGSGGSASANRYSAYTTPVAGKWNVQNSFEYTAGGSATVAKGGKRLSRLTLKVGARNTDSCEGATTVALRGAATIRRLGEMRRPAVGRFSSKTKLIGQTSARFAVDGTVRSGRISVLFDKNGRTAFSARVTVGSCNLSFALRKAR